MAAISMDPRKHASYSTFSVIRLILMMTLQFFAYYILLKRYAFFCVEICFPVHSLPLLNKISILETRILRIVFRRILFARTLSFIKRHDAVLRRCAPIHTCHDQNSSRHSIATLHVVHDVARLYHAPIRDIINTPTAHL